MDYIKLKIKDKSAQDMIEFTFVLPLLIFCFVFILTGGQLIYNKFVAFNAVYNGLRQASVESSLDYATDRLEEIAGDYVPQAISVDSYNVRINAPRDWAKNSPIVGQVNFVVNTLLPFRFNFKSDFNGSSTNTTFLAPNQMNVSAATSAYVEYNNKNTYQGYRPRE